MGLEEQTAAHYTQETLTSRLLDAFQAAGHDTRKLKPEDLTGVDEFHLGGVRATRALATTLDLNPDDHVLDVGCGIGGPARTMARTSGCRVTGIDVTETFVDTAAELSRLVGLADRTRFRVASANRLPFGSGSFDAVILIHVGMNIPNKAALFAELARVVRPGGTVLAYDIMRSQDGILSFPLPWASDPSMSFLASPKSYEEAMRSAGLSIVSRTDRTPMVLDVLAQTQKAPPSIHLGHLMGPGWPSMFSNLVDALRARVVAPVEIAARID